MKDGIMVFFRIRFGQRILSEKCIILFDELYNYSGWDVNEYKALSEVFNEGEYKYLAFSSGCQVCIQMKN